MSIAQIRKQRGIKCKVGQRVRYTGTPSEPCEGVIVGTYNGYLRIRLDGERYAGIYHPTWELEFLPDAVSVPCPSREAVTATSRFNRRRPKRLDFGTDPIRRSVAIDC